MSVAGAQQEACALGWFLLIKDFMHTSLWRQDGAFWH